MGSSNKNISPISQDRRYIDLQLERVKSFLKFLGNPQENYKSILIGGTNGKGSTTHYLSLLAEKYTSAKVGRFISPHIVCPTERVVIDGVKVSKKVFQKTINFIKSEAEEFEKHNLENHNKLTEFEIYAATAFYLFKEANVDLAFIEVGMGGRLDATNTVTSNNTVCSIITNISFDHIQFLGDTIESIAYEKSGIIKEDNILITQSNGNALEVIKKEAIKKNAITIVVPNEENSTYINKNIKFTLQCWNVIKERLKLTINDSGKEEYLKTIQLPARLHYIKDEKIIIDGAHNPAAGTELKIALEERFSNKNITYIIGMLNKDYKGFLSNIGIGDNLFICTEPQSERKTNKKLLAKFIQENGGNAILAENLADGIILAKKQEQDVIVITGSLYLAGEAYTLLNINL